MTDLQSNQGTHILERDPELLKPHINNSDRLIEHVTQKGRNQLIRKLFPGQQERALHSHELVQVNTEFEFRQQALKMAVETKLQALEEMCNHVLVTGKSEIRRKRQAFFADQKYQLQVSMNEYADKFNTEMSTRFDNLKDHKHPFLRDREEQRLLKSVDQFHDMLDQLGVEFLNIINESVLRT